jgi:hypothetical protein
MALLNWKVNLVHLKTSIIFVFLFLISGILSAQEDEVKHISISLNNKPVKEILHHISEQTAYSFAYNPQQINTSKIISINWKNKTVQEALQELSKVCYFGYQIIGKQIVLKPAKHIPRMTVSGFIRDAESGESLPGATVYIAELQSGAVSNPAGFYSLTIPLNEYQALYSSLGYISHIQSFPSERKLQVNARLKTNISKLNTLIVHSDQDVNKLKNLQISKMQVDSHELSSMPNIGGETDLIKSMQTLPGIQVYSDGSAFYYVRGGNRDQNLILLDDSPIYNPAHLFGFYSVIVPDVIKGMNIYKANFPVGSETRLSSVVELQTKDGNYYKPEFNAVLNPLIYRFSLEGPLVKEKSSFFTSFRHSVFKRLFQKKAPDAKLYLFDFNAKINVQLTPKNRLYLSFFTGKDFVSPKQSSHIQWDNNTASLRWDYVVSKKIFFRFVSNASRYQYQLSSDENVWTSAINSLRFRGVFNYYWRSGWRVNAGYSIAFQQFSPGTFNKAYFNHITQKKTREKAFFLSSIMKIHKRWSLHTGLRFSIWENYGTSKYMIFDAQHQITDTLITSGNKAFHKYVSLDPRINLKFEVNSFFSVHLSYGSYHQFVNLITNTTSPFTALEVWLPAGPNISPQEATQWTMGGIVVLPEPHLEFRAEAYYKVLNHQILYKDHAALLLNPLIEGELRFGNGYSQGLEFSIHKKQGKYKAWISYTYSKTLLQAPELNGGKYFSPFYDRPHDFSAYLQWDIHPRLHLSANFIYYTGSAITTPVAFYTYLNQQIPVYGDKNNDRLPDYHRLDLALQWRLNKNINNRFRHSLTLSVFNVYNHHNPISINYNKVKTKNGRYVVPADYFQENEYTTTQLSLLGIMPSLTYKFSIR